MIEASEKGAMGCCRTDLEKLRIVDVEILLVLNGEVACARSF